MKNAKDILMHKNAKTFLWERYQATELYCTLRMTYVFGIMGHPAIDLAITVQSVDMQYLGFRNEQAICYAGYSTSK